VSVVCKSLCVVCQEEWQLLLNYVVQFDHIVSNCVGNVISSSYHLSVSSSSSVATHKVVSSPLLYNWLYSVTDHDRLVRLLVLHLQRIVHIVQEALF